MSSVLLLPTILLPIAGGICLPVFRIRDERRLKAVTFVFTLLTSFCAWGMILFGSAQAFLIVSLAERLHFVLRLDGLGRFFAGIVATLWPLTTLYAFEYLESGLKRLSMFCDVESFGRGRCIYIESMFS